MNCEFDHRNEESPPPASATQLFEDHVSLADRLARRYSFGRGVDDDLRQVAHLGLFLAAQRFDPELGFFVRFATVTIVGELKKHLRSTGWGVRVPRSLQEDSITVAAARDRLTTRLGREPTVGEVADHTGFDTERVVESIRAKEARFSTSLEQVGLDVVGETTTEGAAILSQSIDQLDAEQRHLIHLRYSEGLSQAEIGRVIGVSQPQVHRRLQRSLERLRDELGEEEG